MYRIEKLPVVDGNNVLIGLITYRDIIKVKENVILLGATEGVFELTFSPDNQLQEIKQLTTLNNTTNHFRNKEN